jgi:excinuclease UvrABC nuclease subunit
MSVSCSCSFYAFTLSTLEKYVPDSPGVYGFRYRHYWVYIGSTEKQSLRKRLKDHWIKSHNSELSLWLEAKRKEVQIAYLPLKNSKSISKYEKLYIRKFQPLTNRVLYKLEIEL